MTSDAPLARLRMLVPTIVSRRSGCGQQRASRLSRSSVFATTGHWSWYCISQGILHSAGYAYVHEILARVPL